MLKILVLIVVPLSMEVLTISSIIMHEQKAMKERNFADPKFSAPILNVTVPVSRDAVLTCFVHDLVQYKVAWLRVDTQTILTIQNQIITKNNRISITNTERKIWQLRIKEVRESDKGWYMCQINTDPMKSQMGYLNVVVSPDILDEPTSHDIIVQEYENVTLSCTATGSPEPTIFWKREGLKSPLSIDNKESYSYVGSVLQIPFISKHQAGAYLCIASNGIPPTVSKRITVIVNFKPKIFVQQRIIHTSVGQKTTLECLTESFPNSVNYWMRGYPDYTNKDYVLGGNYETIVSSDGIFKIVMKLLVKLDKVSDFGVYKCIAKNALGSSEEIIKVLPSKVVESQWFHPNGLGYGTFLTNNDSSFGDEIKFIDTLHMSRSSSFVPSTVAPLIVVVIVIVVSAAGFLIAF